MKYSDEYLNHYADRYMALCLRYHGISLMQYLASPEACEQVAERNAFSGRRVDATILPQQISQAERELERGLEHCPRRGGTIVEPLHHHRHSRRGLGADFSRRVRA